MMNCFVCKNKIVTKVLRCPINIIPNKIAFKVSSLCKTEYSFLQPVSVFEIESCSKLIPESIEYLEDYCQELNNEEPLVFDCIDCIDKFADDNWKVYRFNKVKPILFRMKKGFSND